MKVEKKHTDSPAVSNADCQVGWITEAQTGAELLERIRKRRDTIEGARTSCYQSCTTSEILADEILPSLPDDWVWARLDAIADIKGGITKDKKRSPKSCESLPYLRVANVQRGYLDLSEIKNILVPKKAVDSLLLEPGDVLFNEGGDRDKLGRGWVWNGQIQRCIFQNHVFRARFYLPGSMEPKFVSWYANTFGQDYFMAKGKQTTNLASINKTMLSAFPVPIAPISQQKRIVAEIEKQFSRLDGAVANLKRVKANLKRYKAAVLKAAVEGHLVETEAELARREGRSFETGEQLLQRILETRRSQWQGKGKYKEPAAPDTTDLPELPEGWVWASVEQLGVMGQQVVLTGPFGSNIGKADFQDTGVPVLTIGCLRERGLDISKAAFVSESKAEELCRYKLTHGDMLFSRMASVGRAGLVTQKFEGALFNYHIMRLRLEKSAIDPMLFIYYVRGAKAVQDYVREVNHGATRDGINTEQLLNMPVVVPPATEQHRIVAEVDRHLSLLGDTEAQVDANLQRAERLRQSILSWAFAGKLTAPHKEPLEAEPEWPMAAEPTLAYRAGP